MKNIILTIDYEIFFGTNHGTVWECMIEPTRQLAEILSDNGGQMTIFWDILHFKKLYDLKGAFPELEEDYLMIENQILELVSLGHNIELHLHPHWLFTEYFEGKWLFDYSKFCIHSLDHNKTDEWTSIYGCIKNSKLLLERTVKRVKPNFAVSVFRAGGYLIEPFENIKEYFAELNIKYDSSVCTGMVRKNGRYTYDFRNYPKSNKYSFCSSPKQVSKQGAFIEIPITTIRVPFFRHIWFLLLKRFRYRYLNKEIKGEGVSDNNSKYKLFEKVFNLFFSKHFYQLTPDNNFKEVVEYLIEQSKDQSTMILHPKMLNNHLIPVLTHVAKAHEIKFKGISC